MSRLRTWIPGTEELILRAMDRILAGTTSLVIAHQYSTLQGSDRVLVMNEGRLEDASRENQNLLNPSRRRVV